MALCASFEFRVLPTESAMAWSSINVREEYITAFDGLARSTLQRILEIVQMRKMCAAEFGAMSIPAFAKQPQARPWQLIFSLSVEYILIRWICVFPEMRAGTGRRTSGSLRPSFRRR